MAGKPKQFIVLSRQALASFKPEVPYVLISVRGPSEKPAKPYCSNPTLRLDIVFDDVDEDTKSGCPVITENQASRIANFVRQQDGLIVCQCEAGISRSAAIAAACSKYFNGDDAIYFRCYNPNMTVYRKILQSFFNTGKPDNLEVVRLKDVIEAIESVELTETRLAMDMSIPFYKPYTRAPEEVKRACIEAVKALKQGETK